jgi:protoporphyrinogen oxidase
VSISNEDLPGATKAGSPEPRAVVVIGAGPAGLTAAYEFMMLGQADVVTILESDTVVGGISQTVERDGWRFDIGGHRFFTKVKAVDELWDEILAPEKMLDRPRQSRMLYRGKLYDYPLVPLNALRNLGPIEAVRCAGSYVWVRIRRPKNRDTLEGFFASRFGWRLYRHFFKTYTEKVWGVPATELSADWGAQRVKDLSLFRAVAEALKPKRFRRARDSSHAVTSLIEEFKYPKFGPGMMWEIAAEKVTAAGATLEFDRRVTRIVHDGDGAREVVAIDGAGREYRYPCSHLISSMPLGALCQAMDPPVDTPTIEAAGELRYRDHLTVALVVSQKYSFSDNWVYVHDPGVEVGRVQNYGSWSPFMVKEGRTCLGLEFFVTEGDNMWTKPDTELIEQGTRELSYLRLADADHVEAGYVVRMPKAYPVYDENYEANVSVMRKWLATNTPNVFPCGRNGMHKYNNQDHSMFTAMLSVENILGAEHDVWGVNVEAEYLEQSAGGDTSSTGRDAPVLPRRALDEAARARAAEPKADAAGPG